MSAKNRRVIANDNVAQFHRQFLAEYDETLHNVLVELLAEEEGRPERRDLRKLGRAFDQPEVKINGVRLFSLPRSFMAQYDGPQR